MFPVEVVKFIDDTFENWDVDNDSNVLNVILCFKKFSESLVESLVASHDLALSDIVTKLFALLPTNETMILRGSEEMFKELYLNAVIVIKKLSSYISFGDVRDCLTNHLAVIGDLIFLSGFMRVQKPDDFYDIIVGCHEKILNVYSYVALINFVGVENFVEIIMKNQFGLSFVVCTLLPFLRKTSYYPSLKMSQKLVKVVRSKGCKIVGESPGLSLVEQMTKQDAKEEVKEDMKRGKKGLGKKVRGVEERNNYKVWGIVFWFGLLWAGLIFLEGRKNWVQCVVPGLMLPLLVWCACKAIQKRKKMKAIAAERLYYGEKGWIVRERGREARKWKLLTAKKN